MGGKLDGKVALILGSAGKNNMGQVMARRFKEEGAEVVVAGRNEDSLKEISDEINGSYAICDITKKEDIDTMVSTVVERHGKLSIGIQATGWGYLSPFLESTEEDLVKIMNLQFKGPYQFFQACIPAMSEGGSIIQISSATATIMLDNHAAYMGTKAGIDHVIRTIANEFGEKNIRANSISPGLTATPMTAEAIAAPGLEEAFRKCYPLGRIGTSEDIAAMAVFLCSDECFLSGQNLQVNGGLTLRRNPRSHEIDASVTEALASLENT
jgi:NAD(P)-dependent dehydrogenase (short-subunit alcohol dehydrogenase family)